uniref:Transmembrane protein 130 n=1 Tax=Loxodonta africana TaxID=9785 RepID=G3U1Y9_LOXAF
QIVAPTLIQAFQKATVTLNFLGSPPLTMCWRLKPDCHPPKEGDCHSVSVASTTYNLTHTFRSPGDYCFSIRAENVISKTHQYHRIQVWPAISHQPQLLAFPASTYINRVVAVPDCMANRRHAIQKMSDKNPEPPSGARCCCQVCCGPFLLETPAEYLEIVRENHGLLPPLYKSVKTYTV